MRRTIGLLVVACACAAMQVAFPFSSAAQTSNGIYRGAPGHVVIPQSSQHMPADAGVRAHTHIRLFVPDIGRPSPDELPPFAGYAYETPASLACIYRLVKPWLGCNPNDPSAVNPSGGSKTIAIVDAYDDPTAAADLAYFSAQFGLAAPNFTVVYAGGSAPPVDPTGGWELEESLDIEYSHAMAPNAQIYLVEANSNSFVDLFTAIEVATNLVTCGQSNCPNGGHGKGEISMSWGGGEFSEESSVDFFFANRGVVYFASSGDTPGVEYPCASPNVVCVGGTSTARSPYTGNLLYEVAWMDAGGGPSAYEPIPPYQYSVRSMVGPTRGVPDVSFDANPTTGAWIFDSNAYEYAPGEFEPGGWFIVGGTSLGTPSMAGIVNTAGQFNRSSQEELETIYANRPNSRAFMDLQKGYCGPYVGFAATPGWDFCTGLGSPVGYNGK